METGDASQDADNPYNQLSNFMIEKKIGKGQFSEVYRAVCTVNGRPVALKKVQVGGAPLSPRRILTSQFQVLLLFPTLTSQSCLLRYLCCIMNV